ncbi:hypothetical protein NB862_33325, partial [Pseudomonas aeruginosa]|uniref:hypothetical protein n=1 Tax=Pseudomonas aeruginosa TaxID=287 RepID=UPI0022CDFD32
CQSGRWAQQFSGLNYSYITVTLVNPGSGTSSLGYHTYCTISGIGGERPHGSVYKASTIADSLGRHEFRASWNGYGLTMDLTAMCID